MNGLVSVVAPGLTSAPVPLQSGATPLAVAGTVGSLALFLSVTGHIAARNVLGDVSPRDAVGIGPLPAAIATLPPTFGVNPLLAIVAAVAVDLGAIKYLYGREWRLTAYITFIHVVVSIILGAVLVSLALLLSTAPI